MPSCVEHLKRYNNTMTATVFRTFVLCVLAVLLPAAASACSIPPTNYPWIPKYEIYSHMDKDNPLGKYDFIGIVTAKLTPVEEDSFEDYFGNNSNVSRDDYSNVKFTVSETLKGSKEEYFFYGRSQKEFSYKDINREPKIIFHKSIIKNPYKLSDPWELVKYNEAKEIAKSRAGELLWTEPRDFHKNADFRDLLDLSNPHLQRPYRNGLCGDEVEFTIFEDITYLAFKSGDQILHLEPINAEEDTLVDWVRDELGGRKSNYLKISFQDLFQSSSSNRYAVLEITECPSHDSILNDVKKKLPFIRDTLKFKSMSRKYSYDPKLKYAKYDVLVGNVKHEDVSLRALEVYMKHIKNNLFECRQGAQYFAFGRPKDYDERYAYSGFRSQSDFYNWRFMRVENEHILLDDFRTNLSMIDPKKLHLSEIIR